MIRTGEAQGQGFDAGKFKTQVCQYLTALLDCAHLTLDVRTFSSFGSTNLTNPLDGGKGFSYQPGVGGQIVIVRAFYEWDFPAKLPKAWDQDGMRSASATWPTETCCSSQRKPSATSPSTRKACAS